MAEITYPTGVENHGGFLRIWFIYNGSRVREPLGVPDTPKNRKSAGELRAVVTYAIKTGTFDYLKQFPSSNNLKKCGINNYGLTIGDIANNWLSIKRPELAKTTLKAYEARMRTALYYLNGKSKIEDIKPEDILKLRNTLLSGLQLKRNPGHTPTKGRSVVTVNGILTDLAGMFRYAEENGYIRSSPMMNISSMKKVTKKPHPITREEFPRLMAGCGTRQIRNLWALAIYTGMRHGEICALAWEDIDLVNGTILIRRSLTTLKYFKEPKTISGIRTINLIQPAIDALLDQRELTRLGKKISIEVTTREFRKTYIEECTFVFNPKINAMNNLSTDHYSVASIAQTWNTAIRRAGIVSRKAYQSRHTYACWSLSSGANPNFIASQMGHVNSQMVHQVYGAWMQENNIGQVELLNSKLASFAPSLPQLKVV